MTCKLTAGGGQAPIACTPLYNKGDKPDRLIAQYRDSPVLKKFIALYEQEAMGLNSALDCFNDLSIFFCIDQAEGEWLDIIGIIVGQPRISYSGLEHTWFGFKGHVLAAGFGETGGSVGGFWLDENTALTGPRPLTDTEYKIAIKARIAKNHHTGTTDGTIQLFRTIFQCPIIVNDLKDDYQVYIGKTLTSLDYALITQTDLIPNVLGFQLNIAYGPLPLFGFQGIECIAGFDTGTFIGFVGSVG